MKASTEVDRKRLAPRAPHVVGFCCGIAMAILGTGWSPFLAELDRPVQFVGGILCVYCSIQMWRDVLREQSLREFFLRAFPFLKRL